MEVSPALPATWVLLLEAGLVLAVLSVVAAGAGRPLDRPGRRLGILLRSWAARPVVAIGTIALATGAATALTHLAFGYPVPQVVDERSYLLAADTFASGRLANPTHAHWRHFEAPHVLHRPSYASKFPPAQGMALAAGQSLGGHPGIGLWLTSALLCAATGWMLLAWLPPVWAVLGTVWVALHLAVVSYWAQSYWGGSVAAIGGALLFGGVRRHFDRVHVLDALATGGGLLLLAHSRPFEGFLAAAAGLSLLGAGLLTGRLPRDHSRARILLPLALAASLVLLSVGAYNQRVTGDPFLFPHRLYDETHDRIPVFVWQEASLTEGGTAQTPETDVFGWLSPRSSGWRRLGHLLLVFLGLPLILPLLLTGAPFAARWLRVASGICIWLTAGHFLTYSWFPHYSAAALSMWMVLALAGLRRLRVWRRDGRALGRKLFAGIVLVEGFLFAARLSTVPTDSSLPGQQRARLAHTLEDLSGTHLVLIRYPAGWDPDWTYNPADIDASKVVWATDLGRDRNRSLFAYYDQRAIWRLSDVFLARDPTLEKVREPLAEP